MHNSYPGQTMPRPRAQNVRWRNMDRQRGLDHDRDRDRDDGHSCHDYVGLAQARPN